MKYRPLLDTIAETTPLQRYLVELIERCDTYAHAERYSGVSYTTMRRLLRNPKHPIRQQTTRRILSALLRKRDDDRRRGAVSERFLRARKLNGHRQDRFV